MAALSLRISEILPLICEGLWLLVPAWNSTMATRRCRQCPPAGASESPSLRPVQGGLQQIGVFCRIWKDRFRRIIKKSWKHSDGHFPAFNSPGATAICGSFGWRLHTTVTYIHILFSSFFQLNIKWFHLPPKAFFFSINSISFKPFQPFSTVKPTGRKPTGTMDGRQPTKTTPDIRHTTGIHMRWSLQRQG